jgi:hypothetical protein
VSDESAVTLLAGPAGVGIGYYSRRVREGESRSEISGVQRREVAGRIQRRCSLVPGG